MTALALALALSVTAAPAPPPPQPAERDDADRWIVHRGREWMDRIGLGGTGGWDGDVAAGIRGAPPLSLADPLIAELRPLLRTIAGEAPKGIFPPREDGPIPDPSWTLAWLDVDGDGRKEIVLAGGTSPAPFYAVLQRTGAEGRAPWRILHRAPFRFLGADSRSGRLYLFGAFDGYGVAEAALAVDGVDAGGPGPSPAVRVLFHLPGWAARPVETGAATGGCAPIRRTKLRTEPRRDDAPREDGLGGHLPGNLFQTIEVGSTGWRLGAARGADGQRWALCFFAGPSPMDSEHAAREMRTPRKLARGPLAAGSHVLVGWVREADLLPQ